MSISKKICTKVENTTGICYTVCIKRHRMMQNTYRCKMLKKIDILGMKIDNYTVREAMMQVEIYLGDTSMSVIDTIDVALLDLASKEDTARRYVENLDLVVIGEKEILLAADIHSSQRLSEIENHDFFREFARRIMRDGHGVFLLTQTAEEEQQLRDFLEDKYERIRIEGSCVMEDKEGDPEAVVNEINSASADVIFSVLPSPVREQFLLENRNKLDVRIWYGLGRNYAPGVRVNRFSRLAEGLIYKRKLKNRLHKYNKK